MPAVEWARNHCGGYGGNGRGQANDAGSVVWH